MTGLLSRFAYPRFVVWAFVLFAPFLLANELYWSPVFLQRYDYLPLDLALGLDAAQVHAYLLAYGEAGRSHYLWFQLFDFFLPLFGALLLVVWAATLIRLQWPVRPKRLLYAFVACIPMFADWSENIGYYMQLVYFPEVSHFWADFTVFSTHLKLFALLATASLLLLSSLLVVGLKRGTVFFGKDH